MRPQQRREAILTAALTVVRRRGLGGATVREVAAELDVSAGLVHHYFDSMDDLLAEVFDRVAGEGLAATRRAVQEHRGAVPRLVAYLDTYLRVDHYGAFQLWLDAWAEAARRPALRESSRRLNIEWQQLLVQIIDEGVGEGALCCADPDGASWRLMGLLDGLVLQQVAHEIGFDRETVLAWGGAAAEQELGLAPETLQQAQESTHEPRRRTG